VPDQHKVICTLLLNDGSHTWTQELDLILNAPSLNVTSIEVLDPAPGGNNNGVLDPGETATLKLTLMNNGHARAVNGIAHMLVDPQSSPYMLVYNPNIYLGNIPEMSPALAYFNVSANGITPVGTNVYLNCTGTAGLNNQYVVNKTWILEVGLIPEVKMHTGSETTCNSWFYDSGGQDFNYSNYENMTLTFNPGTTGAYIKVKFHVFDVESSTSCNKDYLKVYDGTSTADPLLGTFCGNTLPDSMISTSASGALTFLWRSNSTVTKPGWKALISCVGGPLSIQYNAFPSTVCQGSSSQMAVIPTGGSGVYTYQWIPSIYLDDPTSQFPVSVPVYDISYTVTVFDGTTTLTSSPIPVSLAPVPDSPFITLNGNQLESNLATGNQWYLNDNAIPGATGQTLQLSAYGNYTDVYTDQLSFCSSLPSNIIMYYPVGTGDEASGRSVAVYPNPFSGKFTVAVNAGKQDLFRISVYNTYGNEVLVLNRQGTQQSGMQMIVVDASRLEPGMYFCRIQTNSWTEVRKIILSR